MHLLTEPKDENSRVLIALAHFFYPQLKRALFLLRPGLMTLMCHQTSFTAASGLGALRNAWRERAKAKTDGVGAGWIDIFRSLRSGLISTCRMPVRLAASS